MKRREASVNIQYNTQLDISWWLKAWMVLLFHSFTPNLGFQLATCFFVLIFLSFFVQTIPPFNFFDILPPGWCATFPSHPIHCDNWTAVIEAFRNIYICLLCLSFQMLCLLLFLVYSLSLVFLILVSGYHFSVIFTIYNSLSYDSFIDSLFHFLQDWRWFEHLYRGPGISVSIHESNMKPTFYLFLLFLLTPNYMDVLALIFFYYISCYL